jgi:DNA-binding CsgD family transcriptional regulator
MQSHAEFRIQGTLCRVLAEESLDADSDREPSEQSPPLLMLGALVLDGKRYTIVCESEATTSNTRTRARVTDLLTRRELEVAMLVSEGEGNKQVADRLCLSEWTVSTYLRRIYAKLGVRSRAAMVARIVARV